VLADNRTAARSWHGRSGQWLRCSCDREPTHAW
jgi:hypothetical protein